MTGNACAARFAVVELIASHLVDGSMCQLDGMEIVGRYSKWIPLVQAVLGPDVGFLVDLLQDPQHHHHAIALAKVLNLAMGVHVFFGSMHLEMSDLCEAIKNLADRYFDARDTWALNLYCAYGMGCSVMLHLEQGIQVLQRALAVWEPSDQPEPACLDAWYVVMWLMSLSQVHLRELAQVADDMVVQYGKCGNHSRMISSIRGSYMQRIYTGNFKSAYDLVLLHERVVRPSDSMISFVNLLQQCVLFQQYGDRSRESEALVWRQQAVAAFRQMEALFSAHDHLSTVRAFGRSPKVTLSMWVSTIYRPSYLGKSDGKHAAHAKLTMHMMGGVVISLFLLSLLALFLLSLLSLALFVSVSVALSRSELRAVGMLEGSPRNAIDWAEFAGV